MSDAGYAEVDPRLRDGIRALALRALAGAADASPHRPRAGESVRSLMAAVPAARALLGEERADALKPFEPADRYTDGRGQHRPVYGLLMRAMLGRAGADASTPVAVAEEAPIEEQAMALYAAHAGGPPPPAMGVELTATRDHPLHEQRLDDAPESWTFRELVAIHGTMGVVSLGATGLWPAVAAAARHQQAVTQPDYTTYQPWGLAAFLLEPSTRPFAEQQLHDVQTHLAVEGAPGALVAGLLLADAWCQLPA
ncbi:hypothetical protein [Phycisphaera mikurensis]|uniref:Uncharacterized protein n=1 Tax=Phycisphaera mikurensis (strain NBRC 102666 / KCTC 22515 / FYK2301M01) TaxID=1142394 RepID=I0IGV1_PHYMF|nr:hypothetical protein [Phycisphaera mikurensis]MBB6440746.1 hypothetical protein [Phycisphaera mikurensis]BAM04489.1 hypothetical protein PSMK_23300 [Phycisphaera mikurensis NBRC 102666]